MKNFLLNIPLRGVAVLLAIHVVFMQYADARPVSLETAVLKAQRFLYPNSSESELQSRSTAAQTCRLAYESRTTDKTATCFYVLNRPSSEGYVIVSADDRLPDVLGYSDNGEFDMEQIPDNMKWWLSEYERQIECLLSSLSNVAPMAGTAHRDEWTAIQPLVKSKWGQDSPYNNLCPTENGRTVTGCLATAMAQIMNYPNGPCGEKADIVMRIMV